MALKLITPATAPCVTTAEAKLHLRVDNTAEDALIDSLVAAATADAEHLMGRAVMPQTWLATLDAFPSVAAGTALMISRPPVTSITSVKYLQATDGVLTTLATTAYQLASASDYAARLLPAYNTAWPATRALPEAVQVTFTCGYATAALVPDLIKAWIKLRVGALYANRQGWTAGKGAALDRNEFLDYMLDRYRVWSL